ncbi:DUF2167 domain-containing protein [Niastella populi]|uniref:DUF2167 domain-containing protein n=1 Tax=Niastella populi TaxID=550983 RepID=A0A1V9G807_9BACT|nr:DUF2167 domain-containing protein [Niastella populi]OQP66700.1 hypothetical protein A4R26_13060 [Niastella populi]
MQKALFLFIALIVSCGIVRAKDEDSLTNQLLKQLKQYDSVNKAMKYQTGLVKLPNGIAQLNVPKGFKYLNAEQSQFIIHDLWGNPARPDVIGMLFPENGGPYADSTYAFIISYDETGHVEDEEANKIDYDEMMKNWHTAEKQTNTERMKQGYPTLHIVGWAQKPYYDKSTKVLHWAKELHFGGEESNTLNYDIRILGRKGMLSMNAVANMSELSLVKQDISKVLGIAEFTAGNKYSDFDSNIDKIAVGGIAAVIGGKVLAKAGILAGLGKFLKIIILGIGALIAGIIRFFKGKKQDESYTTYEPAPPADNSTPNA